jgi:hypothetical protein
MIKRLVTAAVLLVAAACNRQVPPDYFPLRAGQERKMRIFTRIVSGKDTTETTEVRVVEIVRGQKDLPGMGKCWVVESPRDSGRAMYSYFKKQEDGVVQMIPSGESRPPVEMLYLALPLAKGLKWWDTKAQREVMEVVAQDTVTVEAGTYPDCFEVVVRSTRLDWTMRQWMAPEVGPVKWENTARWTRKDGVKCEMFKRAELVTYTVPEARNP